MAVVRGLPRFDGRAAFSTWAYRVATNACLDELRRRKRRPEPVDDLVLVDSPGSTRSFESNVVDRIDIDAALGAIPDDFRTALILRDLCGLDYAEIGEVLEIPPGTVRSRISRARTALAQHLPHPNSPEASGAGPSGTSRPDPDVQAHDHG